MAYFGLISMDSASGPAPDLRQYGPMYRAVASKGDGDTMIGGQPIDLCPDPGSIYHLYHSVKLFYENGGGTAFVVSVGTMAAPTGESLAPGSPLVNPNVKYADLARGLQAAGEEPQITMIVILDAVLLPEADDSTLMQNVLEQCGNEQNRIGIIDVYSGVNPSEG